MRAPSSSIRSSIPPPPYTPSMLKVLEEDFSRIPTLLDRAADPPPADEPEPASTDEPEPVQLGLF